MNNFKILCVPEDDMKDVFKYLLQGVRPIKLTLINTPHDVQITNIRHDWYTRCFLIYLFHRSFESVPPGEKYPVITLDTQDEQAANENKK